jgi:hypothetical protein
MFTSEQTQTECSLLLKKIIQEIIIKHDKHNSLRNNTLQGLNTFEGILELLPTIE